MQNMSWSPSVFPPSTTQKSACALHFTLRVRTCIIPMCLLCWHKIYDMVATPSAYVAQASYSSCLNPDLFQLSERVGGRRETGSRLIICTHELLYFCQCLEQSHHCFDRRAAGWCFST